MPLCISYEIPFTRLLGLSTWLWYLTLYILLYMHYVSTAVLFFRAGREIRIALLLYCVISVYDVITSRIMGVIWDEYSVLLSCPGFGYYLWEFINNSTQPVVGTGEDDFPQPFTSFSSFRPGTITFEDFEFPLGVKESMFLLLSLPGLLSAVHTMFRVRTGISREVVLRPAPGDG